MKKEELRKIIDRVPTNVSCNICGDRKYRCCFDLFFNGTSYDVFELGDRGEIYYYAKNVDEDTACEILFIEYKKLIAINNKSHYNYLKSCTFPKCFHQKECFFNTDSLKLTRESENLNIKKIKELCLSDSHYSVVPWYEDPYGLCKVKIYNEDTLVWDGGDSLFYGVHSQNPIISSVYKNALLIEETEPGYSFRPVIIDLKDGTKIKLPDENVVGFCDSGLLYLSNIACWGSHMTMTVTFYDIDRNVELQQPIMFSEMLYAYQWSVCPVPDCILIMTIEPKDNLVLYNVRKREVVQTATFPVDESKQYNFGMYFDKEKQRVIIKSFCPTEPLGSDVQCYSVYFDDFLK